jgi:hypothetical protein
MITEDLFLVYAVCAGVVGVDRPGPRRRDTRLLAVYVAMVGARHRVCPRANRGRSMTAGSSLGSSPMGCCLMAARAKRGPDEPRARPMNPTAFSIRLNRREWAGLPTAKFEPSLLWGSSAYSPQTKLLQLKVRTDPTVQIQRTQATAARRTAAKRGEVRSASQSLGTYRIKSQSVQSIIGTTLGETPALVKKGRTRVGKPKVFPCAGLYP